MEKMIRLKDIQAMVGNDRLKHEILEAVDRGKLGVVTK